MSTYPVVICPRCQASLVSVESGVDGWCAKCGAVLVTPKIVRNRKWSGKAVASVVLGALSMVALVFAAVPAIVLGLLALRDIATRPDELRGKVVAYAGIGMALALGLLGAPFVGAITLQIIGVFKSRVESNNTEVVLQISGELGVLPPDRLIPSQGVRNPVFNERRVTFADEDDRALQQLFIYERRDKALPETVTSTAKRILNKRKQPLPRNDIETRDVVVGERTVRVEYQQRKVGEHEHEIRYCQFAEGEAQFAVYWRVRNPQPDDKGRREQQFAELLSSLVDKAKQTDLAK